jgi:hypothetical protein
MKKYFIRFNPVLIQKYEYQEKSNPEIYAGAS